ncbi:unnamed protein product [Heterobilharzia americana]|nr:unnamed protein product [Heterobilharzia americana]
MVTEEMLQIMNDNIRYKNEKDQEKQTEINNTIPPSNVIIIGACTPVTSGFLKSVLNGEIFGDKLIDIYLYDEAGDSQVLFEISDELKESAFDKLNNVFIVNNIDDCLTNAEQIIILDVVPRKHLSGETDRTEEDEWEPRDQWLRRRYLYFNELGKKVKEKCPNSVRILIAGNLGLDRSSLQTASPLCFDVTAFYGGASAKIPSSQIVGLVKPMELRIRATVANHLKVRTCDVTEVVVWGNIGGSVFVDLSRCCVSHRRDIDAGIVGGSFLRLPAISVAENPKWLQTELVNVSLKENSMKQPKYVGLLYGNSITEFLKETWNTTPNSDYQITSLVMISKEWYGVPQGIAFSFPVMCNSNGSWSIVEDMPMTAESEAQLRTCIQSILEDWAIADPLPLEEFIKGKKPEEIKDDEYEAQNTEEL